MRITARAERIGHCLSLSGMWKQSPGKGAWTALGAVVRVSAQALRECPCRPTCASPPDSGALSRAARGSAMPERHVPISGDGWDLCSLSSSGPFEDDRERRHQRAANALDQAPHSAEAE
jgi:hypothetical protein